MYLLIDRELFDKVFLLLPLSGLDKSIIFVLLIIMEVEKLRKKELMAAVIAIDSTKINSVWQWLAAVSYIRSCEGLDSAIKVFFENPTLRYISPPHQLKILTHNNNNYWCISTDRPLRFIFFSGYSS